MVPYLNSDHRATLSGQNASRKCGKITSISQGKPQVETTPRNESRKRHLRPKKGKVKTRYLDESVREGPQE